VASANCGLYCGAQIDFVDIDPDTGLMSVPSLAAKLQKASRQKALPKVLVPVHLAGSSCDMEAIHSLSKIYGFTIIEDASHAIGGRYKEQSVGSCYYSDITVFSFHPVKIITTGEGGMATTNDPLLAQRMTDLRSHGIVKDTSRFEQEPAGAWIYEQQSLGFNYRMTDLQAALGLSQLQRLEAVVAERQQLLANYEQLLQHLPLQMLKIKSDVASAGHLAVIRLEDPRAEFHRFIFNGLREAGIGVQVHYAPVHLQPYYLKLGFRKDDFPSAEAYALNAISLPLYPGLQSSDQERVVECLAFLLGKRH
jgi:dTDP-4-amino-4,6-dideoxygalactose transaminase